MIELRDVTRVYHVGDVDVTALAGVSLTIGPGEFVAIVGSSGSGKSTLMSILGCLDRPTSGQYFLDGVDVAQLSELTISVVAGWPAPISVLAIVGGFAFAAAVGIFFGYYPARKASRLDPIEALRYE